MRREVRQIAMSQDEPISTLPVLVTEDLPQLNILVLNDSPTSSVSVAESQINRHVDLASQAKVTEEKHRKAKDEERGEADGALGERELFPARRADA